MKTRVVFSAGRWLQVKLPIGHDPAWTQADTWTYATAFAAAVQKGLTEKRAEQVAEAVVSKRLYPGLVYPRVLEGEILDLFR
jgi:hypothetical protein